MKSNRLKRVERKKISIFVLFGGDFDLFEQRSSMSALLHPRLRLLMV